MNDQSQIAPPATFKDKKTGLIILGGLAVAFGCLLAMMIPLTIFGQSMQAKMTGTFDVRSTMMTCVTNTAESAILICLGVGSMLARRWARAIMLILSWVGLIGGLAASAAMAVFLPKIFGGALGGQPLPPPAKVVVSIVMAVLGIIMIVLPIIYILFYRSPHVKATCEARDPKPRWTDACPLPVLAASLFFGMAAFGMLVMPVAINGVLPMFGIFLSGLPGIVAYLVLGGIWGYASYATYKMKPAGWWLGTAAFLSWTVSATITYFRVDPIEMYKLAGYPEQVISQLQQMDFINSALFGWSTVVFGALFLGYMLYVKTVMCGAAARPLEVA
jgi:hypothetical protein